MFAKGSFSVIIVYMETINSSKTTEEMITLRQIICMEELLSKYFLEYFLPREYRQGKGQHTASKDYLSYKDDNVFKRTHYSSNFGLYKRPPKGNAKTTPGKDGLKVLKKYMDDDYRIFDISGFVRNEADYFGLLPNDMHSVGGEKLSSMIQEFNECKDLASTFTQICLEKLFDSRFREEFDKKTNNAFKAEEATNIVNDFVKLCKENYSYTFLTDVLEWDFSIFDYANGPRKRKYGDENNIFSSYKLYGQGEYSKLLIAFRKNSDKSLKELKKEGIKPIFEDEVKIGEYDNTLLSINELFNIRKKQIKKLQQSLNNIKWEKEREIIESKLENESRVPIKIGEFLCKRFNDFIPLEMDGKYNTVHPNKTLREEIFELYKYNANRTERKLPLNSSECETLKKLFINLVNEHGVEKCKEITGDRLFKDYSFNDLNTKETLRKHNISIMTLYKILEVFEERGYIKDGRSNDRSLQSFKEIKNKLLLHNTEKEYVENKKGVEKSRFEYVDERNNEYKREYETEYEEIEDENVAPFSFLQSQINFFFNDRIVLQEDLKRFLRIHNKSVDFLVFDPSEENKYGKIDTVKKAIQKVGGNYYSKIEAFFDEKTEDKKKLFLCRYKHDASESNRSYSLETVLNINDRLMEKIWFAIFLEDLKGNDDKNPWRRLTKTRYLDGIPKDEERAVASSITKSMKNIYESFLKCDF